MRTATQNLGVLFRIEDLIEKEKRKRKKPKHPNLEI